MLNLHKLTRSAAAAALLFTLTACDSDESEPDELDDVVESDTVVEADEVMGSLTGTLEPGAPGAPHVDPTVAEPVEPMPPEALDEGVEESALEARQEDGNDPFDTTPDTIDRARSRAQPLN